MIRSKKHLAVLLSLGLGALLSVAPIQAQTSNPNYGTTTTTDDREGFDAAWLGLLGLFGLMGLRKRHNRDESYRHAEQRSGARV